MISLIVNFQHQVSNVIFSLQANNYGKIVNPVVNPEQGSEYDTAKGDLGATFIVTIWSTAITLGSLLLLVYFLWGSFEWLTAGGDAEQIKKARSKIINAIIGLFLLVAAYAVVTFLKVLLGFDVLMLQWTK